MGRTSRQSNTYKERDLAIKNEKFNKPMAMRAAKYLRSKSRINAFVVAMDAALTRTSETLINEGITGPVMAFTNNGADYNQMFKMSRVMPRYIDARVLYSKIRTVCKHAVVLHDSTRTARHILPDLELLIGGRLKSLALGVNVCTRDSEYGHETFVQSIEEIADENGYNMTVELLDRYRQGKNNGTTMAPFLDNIEEETVNICIF